MAVNLNLKEVSMTLIHGKTHAGLGEMALSNVDLNVEMRALGMDVTGSLGNI